MVFSNRKSHLTTNSLFKFIENSNDGWLATWARHIPVKYWGPHNWLTLTNQRYVPRTWMWIGSQISKAFCECDEKSVSDSMRWFDDEFPYVYTNTSISFLLSLWKKLLFPHERTLKFSSIFNVLQFNYSIQCSNEFHVCHKLLFSELLRRVIVLRWKCPEMFNTKIFDRMGEVGHEVHCWIVTEFGLRQAAARVGERSIEIANVTAAVVQWIDIESEHQPTAVPQISQCYRMKCVNLSYKMNISTTSPLVASLCVRLKICLACSCDFATNSMQTSWPKTLSKFIVACHGQWSWFDSKVATSKKTFWDLRREIHSEPTIWCDWIRRNVQLRFTSATTPPIIIHECIHLSDRQREANWFISTASPNVDSQFNAQQTVRNDTSYRPNNSSTISTVCAIRLIDVPSISIHRIQNFRSGNNDTE